MWAPGEGVLGPVGVGKTMLASTLGQIACRQHHSVLFFRSDQLLKRLKASRLDSSFDQELRRLLRVDLLILDDFGLHALDAQETQDVYEIVVERFRRSSMVLTSNREPQEWLSIMGDPLLAQSAQWQQWTGRPGRGDRSPLSGAAGAITVIHISPVIQPSPATPIHSDDYHFKALDDEEVMPSLC